MELATTAPKKGRIGGFDQTRGIVYQTVHQFSI